MTPTRAVTLVLLVLVVSGFVVQAVRGPAAASAGSTAGSTAAATAATSASARSAQPVVRSLAAVQRAFDAGDVTALCRPGALVDPAVIRQLDRQPGGCHAEVEGLVANMPPLRMRVGRLILERDLATASVTTRAGATTSVDLVRRGGRWLLSFSDGGDPLAALAGTAKTTTN